MLQAGKVFANEVAKAASAAIRRGSRVNAKKMWENAPAVYAAGGLANFGLITCSNIHSSVVLCSDYRGTSVDVGYYFASVIKGAALGAIWPVWYPYALYRHITAREMQVRVNNNLYKYRPGSFKWYSICMPELDDITHRPSRAEFYESCGLFKKVPLKDK